jgi:hypothetical protein
MSNESENKNSGDSLNYLYWRDEILQLMYWMTGEGFGREFNDSDLRRFLDVNDEALTETLNQMVSDGLLISEGDEYALTELGKSEGGRRFADEFETMLKPGHFECDEPDCDCHNPESIGEACKHLLPADPIKQSS